MDFDSDSPDKVWTYLTEIFLSGLTDFIGILSDEQFSLENLVCEAVRR
jgi:hypothetical protein